MSTVSPFEKAIYFTAPELYKPLKDKRVVQTIRSQMELRRHGWRVGDVVKIYFAGEQIGEGEIILIDKKKIRELTEEDALLGGFPDLSALLKRLRRYWRFFKDWMDREVYRIRWKWYGVSS